MQATGVLFSAKTHWGFHGVLCSPPPPPPPPPLPDVMLAITICSLPVFCQVLHQIIAILINSCRAASLECQM